MQDKTIASELGIKTKKLSFNFSTEVAFCTYGYTPSSKTIAAKPE